MRPTVLRTAAFGVAVLAVLDPSLTSERSARPLVAVVSTDHDVLAARARDALDRRFTVVRGVSDAASATVVVGEMPDELKYATGPVFAVIPARRRPDIRIARIDAPVSPQANAQVTVDVHVPVVGATGRDLHVQLTMDGLVVGQKTSTVRADSTEVSVAIPVSPDAGAKVLQATARLNGEPAADSASFVMNVRDDRLPVLFFDSRPSWTSTFARRVIESDTRFSTVHRVVTSRGLSNTAGQAPITLRDLESTKAFATIVVGAPDQLSEGDVSGLETFMRRRGGRVVLVMEARSSAVLDRLSGAADWTGAQLAVPVPITDAAKVELLRARELFWPARLPSAASVHGLHTARDSTEKPIVWSVPVGAGRLIISGAIDAWHYRGAGRDSSGFDAFWSSMIGGQSIAAPAGVELRISPSLVEPGQHAEVRVTVRDAFLSEREQVSARIRASLISDRDSTAIRLWPAANPGVFTGAVVAPRNPGTYRLNIQSGRERASAPLVVVSAANRPVSDKSDLLSAFVSSRGGVAITENDLNRLPSLISSAVESVSRVETWHPMRSPWWIVPFALLLGAEWWWRRRNGLA
jgi:hypothetical protein